MKTVVGLKQRKDLTSRYQDLSCSLFALRRKVPYLQVLAISLVHPRHSISPEQLRLLDDIEEGNTPKPPSIVFMMYKWFSSFSYCLRDILSLLYLKARYSWQLGKIKREPVSIIMKSWCPAPRFLDRGRDFYYGTLSCDLEARGVQCLRLVGDGRGVIDPVFVRAALKSSKIRTIPECLLVPLWVPLVHAIRQWTTAVILRSLARNELDARMAACYAAACKDCLAPFTLRNVFQYYIAKTAVKIWHPKVFLSLYEGQPWESLARYGARSAGHSCLLAGYQHTVVMPHSLSLLSPIQEAWEGPPPEIILCSGERTREMMEPGHHESRFVTFGTFRRSNTRAGSEAQPRPGLRTILVLPEGMLSEARVLFSFAMKVAKQIPDYHFIFRCHPEQPFDKVRPYLADRPERYPNIEISDREMIEEDFARSSVVCYRGSSAVLYAVLAGLKPLYVHQDDFPDIDVLHELPFWRETVSDPSDIQDALGRFSERMTADLQCQREKGCNYIERYAQPVNAESVARFLSETGLGKGVQAP